ncbi:MAG: CsbD family protein, partial [Gemmatimonadales bacterium]
QKTAGKVTGNRSTQAKGTVKEAAGKVQKEAGRAVRKASD